MIYVFETKFKLVSFANNAGKHWGFTKSNKDKAHKKIGIQIANDIAKGRLKIGNRMVFVRLTRICNRRYKMDRDNLGNAFKYVQDAIANNIGIDDGDEERIEFSYHRIFEPKDKWGWIRIEIEA